MDLDSHLKDLYSARSVFQDNLRRNLSASQIQRLVDFAFRHQEYYEELFHCITETLFAVSL